MEETSKVNIRRVVLRDNTLYGLCLSDLQSTNQNNFGNAQPFEFIKSVANEFKETFDKAGINFLEPVNINLLKPEQGVIYEIDSVTYFNLDFIQQRIYLNLPNKIICDFDEGGYDFVRSKLLEDNSIKQLTIVTATQGLASTNSNIQFVVMPFFGLMSCCSTNALTPDFPLQPNTPKQTDKILVPVHKPRPSRLLTLSKLWQSGMLDNADWSLTIDFENKKIPSDWFHSKNVSEHRHKRSLNQSQLVINFIEEHKQQIPKQLVGVPDDWRWCGAVSPDWIGRYNAYIGIDTHNNLDTRVLKDVCFYTEKTFKGFLINAPVYTIANAGFNKLLEQYGFYMPGDYDHLEGEDRIYAVIDSIQHNDWDRDKVANNYILANNKMFWVELITATLLEQI